MAITRSQTKAMYGGRRSNSPTSDRRKTKGTREAGSDSSISNSCKSVVKGLNTFFSAVFLPLLIFTSLCIARQIQLYSEDKNVNWHAGSFPCHVPEWLIALILVTAFSGLIYYTPRDEAPSGAANAGEQPGKARKADPRIKKRRTSVSPPAKKPASGRRSTSPAAKNNKDSEDGEGKSSITNQILAISEKIRSRKATPHSKRTESKKKVKKAAKSKSKSPKKLPISRGNTLLARVDEGDNAKILWSPKPGSVTRSMMNEDQEKIHYNDKYYN